MNNITQVKRGTTASWSLGPELVHWEQLDVWGKDSLIHCEGTDLEMNVYTASANYFYDENRQLEKIKRPGLWLIQPGEIDWPSMSSQAVFRCKVSGPSDCWIEVYSELSEELHGQKIYLNSQPIEMTIPYHGKWGLYMRWPEERTSLSIANVKLSIREVGAYEELAPGQLGIEYTDDGKVKLKAGMPNESKWNELPYIGGTGSAAIIDVVELPEDDINEDVFYRLLKGTLVFNQRDQSEYNQHCICVNELPKVGQPVTTDMTDLLVYYSIANDDAYGYITEELGTLAGISEGWYTLDMLAPAFETSWSGIITDIKDDPCDDSFRLWLKHTIYSYKGGWISQQNVGGAGIGDGAEWFNHPANIASGAESHAEGYRTQAIGGASHAEGESTTAEGACSHSEGLCTTAHSEYSHAEGSDTIAEGACSHSEGFYSHARGKSQHVQGEYNVLDPEYRANATYLRGKYAHIVGNGTSHSNRSNAHTLDWDGNAWFAGDVYIGGTGQDDEDAKRLGALVLPDPTNAEFEECALVNKNGAWVLSDTPVATRNELSSFNGQLSSVTGGVIEAHNRIDALEAQIGFINEALSNILEIQQSLIDSALPAAEGVEF